MQLKIYDILSSLIPGTLVLGVLLSGLFFTSISSPEMEQYVNLLKDLSGVTTTIFLTASYLIGYLIHALGSWVEPILWFTWGGRPSQLLLQNKVKRLGMVFYRETLEYLIESSKLSKTIDTLEKGDFKKVFQVAKNKAFLSVEGKHEERLSEFNNSYIFSRNILVAVGLSFLLCLYFYSYSLHWQYTPISIGILIILWFRCRDKAIYYSREILTIAYSKK